MFLNTSEIGIDAGHRVPDHKSKCQNMHGHRYRCIATVGSEFLVTKGEETGMVMDFAFAKEEMRSVIEKDFDHSFIFYYKDPFLRAVWPAGLQDTDIQVHVGRDGHFKVFTHQVGTLTLVKFVPTAEQLAWHWATLLQKRIELRSEGRAQLTSLQVYETPNHSAIHNFPIKKG